MVGGAERQSAVHPTAQAQPDEGIGYRFGLHILETFQDFGNRLGLVKYYRLSPSVFHFRHILPVVLVMNAQ